MTSNQFVNAIKLTTKQTRFVQEYLKCLNGTEAARLAGYKGSYRTLSVVAHELSRHPLVKHKIDEATTIQEVEIPQKAKRTVSGSVYLIREPFGRIKIGIAADIGSRLSRLSTSSAYELELLFSVRIENARQEEAFLHKTYASKRVRGEWFELTHDEIEEIKQRYDPSGGFH